MYAEASFCYADRGSRLHVARSVPGLLLELATLVRIDCEQHGISRRQLILLALKLQPFALTLRGDRDEPPNRTL
jgi:hypothetical protein